MAEKGKESARLGCRGSQESAARQKVGMITLITGAGQGSYRKVCLGEKGSD